MKHQKPDDVETIKEKLFAQKKKLVTGLIIFLSVILAISAFYIYNLKKESDARQLEAEAYRYYSGFVKDTNLSIEQKFSKAGELFEQAYAKKKNITYLLNAGYAYEYAGKTQKAVECLGKVASFDDENFSNLAKFKMAMIYLKNNDKAGAYKILKEIVAGKHIVMKDFASFELAKITENKEEAKNYYEAIVKNYSWSPLVDSAKKALEQLNQNKS